MADIVVGIGATRGKDDNSVGDNDKTVDNNDNNEDIHANTRDDATGCRSCRTEGRGNVT